MKKTVWSRVLSIFLVFALFIMLLPNMAVSAASSEVAPIIMAGDHTVALKNDGTVWAWGLNNYGQLGDGSSTTRNTPVQVQSLSGITAIAGNCHNVALKNDGTVWAWGYNASGQLGDGSTTNRNTPVQIKSISNVTAIAAGGKHTVALKSDGTVWAWGYNADGALGDGSTTSRKTPIQVKNLSGVVAIAAGWSHTIALRDDGTVWAWGYNGYGQLGNGISGEKVYSSTPVQVEELNEVSAIAAGSSHTLALKTDGTVWAWGLNAFGQLGDNTSINRSIPVQVQNLSDVITIAAGSHHTVALKNDGTVWGCGWNDDGQLGDGTITSRKTPVQAKNLSGANAIAAGWNHTVASKSEGSIWAWGCNSNGRLGDGTATDRSTPVKVKGQSNVGYINLLVTKIRLSYSLTAATYNGKPQGVTVIPKSGVGAVTVYYTGINGTSYTKTKTKPTKMGTYAITVDIATGTEYGAISSVSLGIYKIRTDLSKATVTISDMTWTGGQLKPTKFTYSGKSHYISSSATVNSYGTNKNIGKGTIKLTGKDIFTGTKTITFKILPRKNSVSKITVGSKQMKVTWSKVSSAQKITRYQMRYRMKGKTTWTTKTYYSSTSSATIKSLTKGKQYEVQARCYKTVSGVNYYSGWSATKTSGTIK